MISDNVVILTKEEFELIKNEMYQKGYRLGKDHGFTEGLTRYQDSQEEKEE